MWLCCNSWQFQEEPAWHINAATLDASGPAVVAMQTRRPLQDASEQAAP